MTVELDRWDLIRLLTSINPDYEFINDLKNLGFGTYIGGFNDRWDWKPNKIYDSNLSDEEIYELYKKLKK